MSPSRQEILVPGRLTRISVTEPVDHPTIRMPYGQEVPLVHASAGMRRVVALAYLLVWTWQEHLHACELQGERPAREIIFLIDEVEAHLHPQWQRRIVPALLDVMEALTGASDLSVQLLAATHSPLVLASTETLFDPKRDAIWELDLCDNQVELHESPWVRYGDANAWLTSSVFDMREPRSVEAEEAITAALALLRRDSQDPEEIERVDGLLRNALSDIDRFWVRWSHYRESLGRLLAPQRQETGLRRRVGPF
jgi:predicted ATP-binding protein involved in virulence